MNNYLIGLELLVIGMGTVFLSLYLLSLFLYFSGKVFASTAKDKKESRVINKKDFRTEEGAKKLAEKSSKISPKKAAAVSAAIYECLDNSKSYKIISIKKNNKNWKNRR